MPDDWHQHFLVKAVNLSANQHWLDHVGSMLFCYLIETNVGWPHPFLALSGPVFGLGTEKWSYWDGRSTSLKIMGE